MRSSVLISFLLLFYALCGAQDTNSAKTKNILILGNSITAGYGLSTEQAYPAHLQHKIDSLGLNYKVVNAGLSGETTSGGLRRIDWLLRQPVDIFILALGGNDGLRGIGLNVTRQNLFEIVEKVRAKNPGVTVVLAGMQIPPNLGPEYTKEFRQVYPQVAKEADTKLIPFLLKDVGGFKELNLPDGIHPNAAGHVIVAENVWEVLKPLLE